MSIFSSIKAHPVRSIVLASAGGLGIDYFLRGRRSIVGGLLGGGGGAPAHPAHRARPRQAPAPPAPSAALPMAPAYFPPPAYAQTYPFAYWGPDRHEHPWEHGRGEHRF